MLATRERWRVLCQRIGARDNPVTGRTIDSTYDEIVAAYTEPDRYYHDRNHINDGLALIDEMWHQSEDPDALEMAWWWHDYVYKVPTEDNELISAVCAFRVLSELSIPSLSCVKVMMRVMSTLHNYFPEHIDDRLMVDIDLASLATPTHVFDKNTANIRREYPVISDEDFRVGRAIFFRTFLTNRPSIYLTKYFRDKYEAKAQENLQRFIAKAGI